jgi:hypothetical protein
VGREPARDLGDFERRGEIAGELVQGMLTAGGGHLRLPIGASRAGLERTATDDWFRGAVMSWAARTEQRKDAGRVNIGTRYWPDRGRRDATVRSRSPTAAGNDSRLRVQARDAVEPLV